MTWTYRTYRTNNTIAYAELEDHSGEVIRRYYPRPHPKIQHDPDIATGEEVLPDDDVPSVGVRGFDESAAIDELRQEAYDALPEDDSEPVTAGTLRKVLSLVEQDVERETAVYQGDVDRGWDRGRNPDQGNGTGRGPGLGPGERAQMQTQTQRHTQTTDDSQNQRR